MQDDSSAPKNRTKAKECERLFRDYMHYRNHDTIPNPTPTLEAENPHNPACYICGHCVCALFDLSFVCMC